MADELYVAWQDNASRSWHTIGRLTRSGGEFELVFTKGAARLGDLPRKLFGMERGYRYRFAQLLPIFANKVPPRSRADFVKMAQWVGAAQGETDFDLLAKFGMLAGNDSIIVYPAPSRLGSQFRFDFFVHALRYMEPAALDWCQSAKVGMKLLPMLDVQNSVDINAVALRCATRNLLVGYMPTFYAHDVRLLLADREVAASASVTILRNNVDAPAQVRLLCRFSASVRANFIPLQTLDHELDLLPPQVTTTKSWLDASQPIDKPFRFSPFGSSHL